LPEILNSYFTKKKQNLLSLQGNEGNHGNHTHQSPLFSAALVCLLRDDIASSASEQRQEYDEQIIEFCEFLQECKKTAASDSIFSIRYQLEEMLAEVGGTRTRDREEELSEKNNNQKKTRMSDFDEQEEQQLQQKEMKGKQIEVIQHQQQKQEEKDHEPPKETLTSFLPLSPSEAHSPPLESPYENHRLVRDQLNSAPSNLGPDWININREQDHEQEQEKEEEEEKLREAGPFVSSSYNPSKEEEQQENEEERSVFSFHRKYNSFNNNQNVMEPREEQTSELEETADHNEDHHPPPSQLISFDHQRSPVEQENKQQTRKGEQEKNAFSPEQEKEKDHFFTSTSSLPQNFSSEALIPATTLTNPPDNHLLPVPPSDFHQKTLRLSQSLSSSSTLAQSNRKPLETENEPKKNKQEEIKSNSNNDNDDRHPGILIVSPPPLPLPLSSDFLPEPAFAFSPQAKPPRPEEEEPEEQNNGKKNRKKISESLYGNLLASTEGDEDILNYVQRAYSAIRNKFVDEALENTPLDESVAMSMSTTASRLGLPPPQTSSGIVAGDVLSVGNSQLIRPTTSSLPLAPLLVSSFKGELPEDRFQRTQTIRTPFLPSSSSVNPENNNNDNNLNNLSSSPSEGNDENEEEKREKEGEEAFLQLLKKHSDEENKEEGERGGSTNTSSPSPPVSFNKRGGKQSWENTPLRNTPRTREEGKDHHEDRRDRPSLPLPPSSTGSLIRSTHEHKEEKEKENDQNNEMRRSFFEMSFNPKEPEEQEEPEEKKRETFEEQEKRTSPLSASYSSFNSFQEKKSVLKEEKEQEEISPKNRNDDENRQLHDSPLTTHGQLRDHHHYQQQQSSSSATSASSSQTGKKIKQAIVLEQMRTLQAAIELEHQQKRSEKNLRRVKLGERVLAILQNQQKPYQQQQQSGPSSSSSPSSQFQSFKNKPVITSIDENKHRPSHQELNPPRYHDHQMISNRPVSPVNKIKEHSSVLSRRDLEETFFTLPPVVTDTDYPPTSTDPQQRNNNTNSNNNLLRKISSIDHDDHVLEIHASPKISNKRVDSSSSAPNNHPSREEPRPEQGQGAGLAWNIETTMNNNSNNRPRSRIQSFPNRRRETGVEEMEGERERDESTDNYNNKTPSPSSPPQNKRIIKRPLSSNEIIRKQSQDKQPALPRSPPQVEVEQPSSKPSQQQPQPQPQPRSQSANRAQRPASRSAAPSSSSSTATLSNFVQVKNAINYVCLAGGHQEEKRNEVLDLLDYYHHHTGSGASHKEKQELSVPRSGDSFLLPVSGHE
jgi:hypothetical protein